MTTEHSHEHDEKTVTVNVNNKPVVFSDHKATGMEIKVAAINQGVQIEEDFNLFEDKGDEPLKSIGNDDTITIHRNQEFTAVPPDDNS